MKDFHSSADHCHNIRKNLHEFPRREISYKHQKEVIIVPRNSKLATDYNATIGPSSTSSSSLHGFEILTQMQRKYLLFQEILNKSLRIKIIER
jgi:hypothetical protein